MKQRCLTNILVLTLATASPSYPQRRPLDEQLVHHVFSERKSLIVAQLHIKARHARNVTILDLTGAITKGESSQALRAAVTRLSKQSRNILVNLEKVTVIDSTGLGVMVSCYTTVNKNDGRFALLNVTKNLRDLLVITKLLTVFDVYEDEAEAIKTLATNSSAEPKRRSTPKGTQPVKTEPPPCPAGSGSESELRKRIREIIADVLGRNVQQVRGKARLIQDLGADSLDACELVMRFEEQFNIEIPDEYAEKFHRVRDVYCYIEKQAQPASPR